MQLDAFVVMPNHVHGILIITDEGGGGWQAHTAMPTTKTLGRLLGAFKTKSTRWINEMRGTPSLPVWQRNYYDHVVRDDDELNRIREYIADNPRKWAEDPENPGNTVTGKGPV